MTKLSEIPTTLYNAIAKNGSMWEANTIEVVFPKPIYSTETAAEYWQWEVNAYGYRVNRPVNGEFMWFDKTVETLYKDVVYNAIKELKANNLIYTKNNGCNEYSYHTTK